MAGERREGAGATWGGVLLSTVTALGIHRAPTVFRAAGSEAVPSPPLLQKENDKDQREEEVGREKQAKSPKNRKRD